MWQEMMGFGMQWQQLDHMQQHQNTEGKSQH